MKVLLSVVAIVLAFSLNNQAVAESGHGGQSEHSDLSAGHGSGKVFPKPTNDLENSKAPGSVELTEPAFMSTASSSTVLKWKEAKDAQNYHVQVATDPNFKWLVANEYLYTGTSFEVKSLEAGKHYYWRVAGTNQTKWLGSTHGDFTKSMFETK